MTLRIASRAGERALSKVEDPVKKVEVPRTRIKRGSLLRSRRAPLVASPRLLQFKIFLYNGNNSARPYVVIQ
jgi:hypothetical protein